MTGGKGTGTGWAHDDYNGHSTLRDIFLSRHNPKHFGARASRCLHVRLVVRVRLWWPECSIGAQKEKSGSGMFVHLHIMPYHTITYYTKAYHNIPYMYHTCTYHTIPYHTIPCHAMPCHAIPYHTIYCTYTARPSEPHKMS